MKPELQNAYDVHHEIPFYVNIPTEQPSSKKSVQSVMTAFIIATFIISIFGVMAIIGIIGNLFIVYATIKSRKLRMACNIFIAVNAFCSIFHQSSHFFPAYSLYSGDYYILSTTCLKIQTIPNICMNISAFIIITIGCDRLFMVISPLRYRQCARSSYIVLMLIPPISYSCGLLFIAAQNIYSTSTMRLICVIVAIYNDFAALLFTATDSTINIVVIVIYLILFMKVRCANVADTDKLIRPILIIGFFAAFNWVLSLIAIVIRNALHLDEMEEFCLELVAGISMNIEMAFGWLIFYKFSSDYRSAFRQVLGLKKVSEAGRTGAQPTRLFSRSRNTQ